MRKYIGNSLFGIMLLFYSFLASADSSVKEKYKENYIAQVVPMIEQKLSASRPKMNQREIRSEAISIAKKMAGCQLKAMTHYPIQYQTASIEPIANGENLRAVTDAVNLQVKSDIQNGKLSEKEFTEMVEKGISRFKACMH